MECVYIYRKSSSLGIEVDNPGGLQLKSEKVQKIKTIVGSHFDKTF